MKNQQPSIFYDLISNKNFRDWVKNPNEERDYYWKKWMDKNCGQLEDVKKAREFIERITFKKEQLLPNELDILLGKIIAQEKSASHSVSDKKKNYLGIDLQWLKVAAALLVFSIAAVAINELVVELSSNQPTLAVEWKLVENPKGRKSKVTLPDGSQVNLNYESQLRFPVVFDGDARRVELIGEAYFEVVHNETMPFIVTTGPVETEVLGTSFNIRSYGRGENTDISLVTGKVKVTHPRGGFGESILLFPGEQLRYNRNSGDAITDSFDVERVVAWKDGIILFKDAGLDEFIDQLERWYGVDFQIYGVPSKEWKVNGRYQNEELDDILEGLSFVYGLEYRIQGKNVILDLN